MSFIQEFELNIFAIMALFALLLSIYYKEEIYSYSNRLLRAIIFNTILINILEILSWVFDGQSGALAFGANYFFNFVLIILTPGIPAFWASYIDYKVYGSRERVRRRLVYMHGFIIGCTLMIANFFTPIMFYIDENNIYHRGPMLWFNLLFVYGLLIHATFMVWNNRKRLKNSLLTVAIIFLVLPSVAAYMQMTNYGLHLMWPTTAISVIVVYLFLETSSSSKDYLTGLYNRSKLDEFTNKFEEEDLDYTVVMIDLDDYKKINDTYGHSVGDELIVVFGNLLVSVFPDNAIVSRYGGDEFLIVFHEKNDKEILKYKDILKTRISEYDDELVKGIKFSFGYATRSLRNRKPFEKLLVEADDFMYQDKALNKNYKRRKDDR